MNLSDDWIEEFNPELVLNGAAKLGLANRDIKLEVILVGVSVLMNVADVVLLQLCRRK